MSKPLHTVCETPQFVADAEDAGMTEEEREGLTRYLSENPDAGDVMEGTGGVRKLRWAGRGKGKSGGYRVITAYFASYADLPVFLLAAFGKGDKANLTKQERNELKKLMAALPKEYRKRKAKQ